jgi:hypothetical protein
MRPTHSEEIQLIEGARVGVGGAQADKDDADERCNGENVRREDTRDPARCTHVGT